MPGSLGISEGYFSSGGVLFGSGLLRILFCYFKPEADGLTDVLEGFLSSAALAPASRQRRTLYGEAFL